MTVLAYPRNLPGLSATVVKRPKHSVELQTHTSGGEVRIAYWAEPLWEWDISYDVLRDGFRNGAAYDELRQVVGLFLACGGSRDGFSFRDPDDHKVFRQAIGTTDGLTSAFTLARAYGANDPAAGYEGTEAIGLLDLDPPDLMLGQSAFNLYVDGSATPVSASDPVFGYTLATTSPKQQQIVFNTVPPPAHALGVDMHYLYYVRFGADVQEFEKFMHQLWALKKVTLVSLRFGSGGSSQPSSTSQAPGRSITVASSPLQLTNADGYVGITNTSGAALEIDLPLYPSANQVVNLVDEGGNAFTDNWTIKWNGNVVGTVVTNDGFISLRWNGTGWYQLGAQ